VDQHIETGGHIGQHVVEFVAGRKAVDGASGRCSSPVDDGRDGRAEPSAGQIRVRAPKGRAAITTSFFVDGGTWCELLVTGHPPQRPGRSDPSGP
ncbi:MAG: hypothetical protein ACM3L9_03245, partial [Deltaproteobacteria bacterium]